jgi:hypothetical protein
MTRFINDEGMESTKKTLMMINENSLLIEHKIIISYTAKCSGVVQRQILSHDAMKNKNGYRKWWCQFLEG